MTESKKMQGRVFHRVAGKLQPGIKPIVIEYQKQNNRKESDSVDGEEEQQYSEGLEDVQRLEGDLVRIARRSAKALSKSLDTYEEERRRSALEKKDGAIEDFVHNSAMAASTYLKEASEIPADIAESLNTKNYRTRLRKSLRRASKIIRTFRI